MLLPFPCHCYLQLQILSIFFKSVYENVLEDGKKTTFAKSLNEKLRGCIKLTSAPCPLSVCNTYIYGEESCFLVSKLPY